MSCSESYPPKWLPYLPWAAFRCARELGWIEGTNPSSIRARFIFAVHHKPARRHSFALRGPDSPLKLRDALLAQQGRHSFAMGLIGNRQYRFLRHSLSSQRPPVCRELVRINGRRIAVRFQSIRVLLAKTVT